jgi:hypothetical protein
MTRAEKINALLAASKGDIESFSEVYTPQLVVLLKADNESYYRGSQGKELTEVEVEALKKKLNRQNKKSRVIIIYLSS